MPELRREDEVFVLELGEDENRFSPDWLAAVNGLLDDVLDAPAPRALVTLGQAKFYSNGLDVEWLMANGEQAGSYIADVQELLARMLTLPIPTVAAVNGHAFGAGAMLALAHDFRVMRADRGYYCFPEVDIGFPFTPGMAALIQGKTTPKTAVATMTTGRRFGGPEALELGLVDETSAESEVRSRAVELARPLAGKDPGTLGAVKDAMFGSAASTLRDKGD